MTKAVSEFDESWYRSSQINQGMRFDGSLVFPELRPWKKTQAQFNACTIERICHVVDVNIKIVIRLVQRPCFGNQNLGKVSKDSPVPAFICVSQGGPLDQATKTSMIDLLGNSIQTGFNVTQAFFVVHLGKHHHHQLLATIKMLNLIVAIVSLNALIKLIPW